MLKAKNQEKMAEVVLQGVFACFALAGLLAGRSYLGKSEDSVAGDAWKLGDQMAAEFMKRGNAVEKEAA